MKKNPVFLILQICLGLVFIPGVCAEIYKWVDQDGVTHFSDRAPNEAQVVGEVKSKRSLGPSGKAGDQTNRQTSKEQSDSNQGAKVELYTTSWCPYCKKARQFFRSQGIAFKEYDIEKDKKAAARKNQLDSKKGVPFAVVNGEKIHGYAPEAYQAALERNK